jgi:hypothetical protein
MLFWLLLGYVTITNIEMLTEEQLSLQQQVMLFFMHLFAYGPIVYFNNLYLLPKFFSEGDYFKYFAFTVSFVLIYTIYTVWIIDYYAIHTPSDLQKIDSEDLNYFVGVIGNLLWVATFSMTKIGTDHLTEKSKLESAEKEKAESELSSLKNQINPHFLFNGLNSIYGLSITKDERTSDSIMKLSEIMRYVLYECNDEKVTLEKEIDYINNYISFGKLRRKHVHQIKFDVQGHIIGKRIAPLILIPFIENAFKHGLDSQIIDPWIAVEINIEDKELIFKCSNSSSKKKDILRKDNGIGLANVRRRLALLYPDLHQLNISAQEREYTVQLNIQL